MLSVKNIRQKAMDTYNTQSGDIDDYGGNTRNHDSVQSVNSDHLKDIVKSTRNRSSQITARSKMSQVTVKVNNQYISELDTNAIGTDLLP